MSVAAENSAGGELLGSVLAGKYRIERIIGSGGMGHVVEATHLELEERVALKFLNADGMNDPEMLARFKREAKLAAKIKSEHVAKVSDVGRLENGAPYIVMEMLRGRDLAQVLRERRRLPTHEAADYLLQAIEALAEAHALGIVHRDLKPQNLFLTQRKDGSGCIKVLDFGISKLMPSGDSVEAEGSLTHTTSTLGSPLYMSPEQMTNPKAVDARADIWALGATLYRLIAGKPPFNGESVAQVCGMILIGDPPPPVTTIATDAPPAVDEVIRRCLQKDPEARFANIGDLAAALAPLGTPAAVTSAERAIRVLQSAGFEPNVAVPRPVPSSSTLGAPPSTPNGAAAAWSVASASWPSVGLPSSPPGAAQSSPSVSVPGMPSLSLATDTARSARTLDPAGDRTQAVWEHGADPATSSGKKRTLLLVAGALVMLGLGAAGAALLGGGPGEPAATATSAAAPQGSAPSVVPSAALPVVTPSSTTSASAAVTAEPSATAAAPPPRSTAKGGPAVKTRPTSTAKGKQGDDLFDERF